MHSPFTIHIEIDRRVSRYQVEHLPDQAGFEQFLVSGRNKSITLRTNRPMLRAKGLKHKRPSWEVVGGGISAGSYVLEKITRAILQAIE